jgi:hypothetical protein
VKKPGAAAAVVVASISSPSLPNVSIGNNAIPNSDDVYELFAVSKKLSAMKVFDFIQDCYVAQWGVILRNGYRFDVYMMMLFNVISYHDHH